MGTDNTPDNQQDSPQPSCDNAQDFASRTDVRIDTKGIHCNQDSIKLKVADLTGTGMRLTISNANLPEVGSAQTYTFTDQNTEHELTVQGTVRWVRKGSVLTRKAEIGIEFINLSPSIRDALVRLAVQGELLVSNQPHTEESSDEPQPLAPRVNLYDILAINQYASESDIKAAYHKLVKHWHPDKNKEPEAPARFEELHKAYSILKDPTLRARYDERFGPDQQSDQAAA
ncbi:MAG: DnaJ domain-containing protein [Phycisphaerales bacterium]|nr:DnaJ domain-containing protein [Phycisphaerales bacterium]